MIDMAKGFFIPFPLWKGLGLIPSKKKKKKKTILNEENL